MKAWFELVVIPRCLALGLPVPPHPELFRQLVADDMTVFVRDIYSPDALANELAWDADVRRAHGIFTSIRNNQRLADGSHQFLRPGFVNPSLDFDAFDTNLLAYIDFTDGEIDAQPKKGSKLHIWKQNQLSESEIRVHPGWIPRIAALRAVLALKPSNRRLPRPIWDASKYAHIKMRIENGYPED